MISLKEAYIKARDAFKAAADGPDKRSFEAKYKSAKHAYKAAKHEGSEASSDIVASAKRKKSSEESLTSKAPKRPKLHKDAKSSKKKAKKARKDKTDKREKLERALHAECDNEKQVTNQGHPRPEDTPHASSEESKNASTIKKRIFDDGYSDDFLQELKKTDPARLKEIRKARKKQKRKIMAVVNVAKEEEKIKVAQARKLKRMREWEEKQVLKAEEERRKWEGKPTKVFVGGLPFGISEKGLQRFFIKCGKFAHVDMPLFEDSGRSMGVAHIDFMHPKAAAKCVAMNEVTWRGRWLKIVYHDQMTRDDGRYEEMCRGRGNGSQDRKSQKEQDKNPGPVPEGCTRLWIGGLAYDATKNQVAAGLEEYGEIVGVQISTDKDTNESKGFGHVTFADSDSCERAMKGAAKKRGVVVGTQLCRIDYATTRPTSFRDDATRISPPADYKSNIEKKDVMSSNPEQLHWKKAPTRSRNRGALEEFKGNKVTFGGGSDSD